MPSKHLEAPVPKNRVKPWIELPRRIEPAERLIGVEKCLLHSIERILAVGKNGPGMSQCFGLIPLDKVAKGVSLTRLAPFDGNCVIHLPST